VAQESRQQVLSGSVRAISIILDKYVSDFNIFIKPRTLSLKDG